jgi:hypothetical protein
MVFQGVRFEKLCAKVKPIIIFIMEEYVLYMKRSLREHLRSY